MYKTLGDLPEISLEDLPDATAFLTREDYLFSYPQDDSLYEDLCRGSETFWLERLREYLPLYSFVERCSPIFYSSGHDIIGRTFVDENDLLRFMISFVDLDRTLIPSFIFITKEWKSDTVFSYYNTIARDRTRQSLTRLKAVSYCLDEYVLRRHLEPPEDLLHYLRDKMQTRDEQSWEAYDVLNRWLLHTEVPPEDDLFHQVQQYRNHQIHNETTTVLFRSKDVFEDDQNVHNSGIHKDVLEGVSVLYQEYNEHHKNKPLTPEDEDLISDLRRECGLFFSGQKDHPFETFLHRMETDPTRILTSPKDMTTTTPVLHSLRDVVRYIWWFIGKQRQKHGEEYYLHLLQRFYEEACESADTCFSGHVARMVNIVSGFHETVRIGIDPVDQYSFYLRDMLQNVILSLPSNEEREKIMEDMIEPKPGGVFYDFLMRHQTLFRKTLRDHALRSKTPHKEAILYTKKAWARLFPSLRVHDSFLFRPVLAYHHCYSINRCCMVS